MRRRPLTILWLVALTAGLLLTALPASADHTNPNRPQSPTGPGLPGNGITTGEGSWQFIRNFPPNPGSDVTFFEKNGELYSVSGTLGQANEGFVGQRFLRLVDRDGNVDPQWVADHGSAKCTPASTSVLGLQHDQAVTPARNPLLMVDTTDATGRCHDTPGGGLELVDISGLGQEGFEVREVRLLRLRGLSHTVTADPNRPGIFYNSTSDSNTPHLWIDIVDARSCMFRRPLSEDPAEDLAAKRERCNPKVFRLSWEHRPEWTQRDPDGEEGPQGNEPGSQSACHDITVVGNRLYCASLNATIVFDTTGMWDGRSIRGRPLPCLPNRENPQEIPGTRTGAKVTDCSVAGPRATEDNPEGNTAFARGWRAIGNYNHPGRPPGQLNNNLNTPASEGVSVAHESDPDPDERWLFVTDERGGGVVPPGASCSPGIDNPYGNGGIHVLQVRDDRNPAPDREGRPLRTFRYARDATGDDKAIWRGNVVVPAPTFCTVHVIQHMPDERRIFMGYYSQGMKVLDYSVARGGRFSFDEVASFIPPGANSWVSQPFKVVDNADGTRTYFMLSSDIDRGIDILSWTGETNRARFRANRSDTGSIATADAGLLVLGLLVLPAAAAFGRRRRLGR